MPGFDAVAAAEEIEMAIRAVATPERAENEKRYLKSDLEFLGATVPAIRNAVKHSVKLHPGLDRTAIVALAGTLWAEPIHERRMAAVEVLAMHAAGLAAEDVDFVETLIRESKTWALVDPLAATIAGSLVERFPDLTPTLDRWAVDGDFWVRRSALLALMKGLSRGEGDFERFGRYADAMLDEKEFFIRKAIGWVLRETAKKRPDLVAEWLGPRTHRVSGVTMREAVKRLSPEQRDALMAAYREKRPAV